MIPAVAQTLAEILASGTFLSGTEQIDFNPPALESVLEPGLNLYCCSIRESNSLQPAESQRASGFDCDGQSAISGNNYLASFEVSFLVSAWDDIALGEQQLLSETLNLLLRNCLLREELLAPELRGDGSLPIEPAAVFPIDTATRLNSLGLPLRPALPFAITVPFDLNKAPPLTPEALLSPTR